MPKNAWNVTWRHPRNAVALAGEVAERAIVIHKPILRDEIQTVVIKRLEGNCSERLHSFHKSDTQYRLFRDRYRDTDPTSCVFKLVDLAAALWHNPERKIRQLYRWGPQAGVYVEEIAPLELEHRFDDLDPDGALDRKHRLAFEAAWLAGQYRFARQLVMDALYGPSRVQRGAAR